MIIRVINSPFSLSIYMLLTTVLIAHAEQPDIEPKDLTTNQLYLLKAEPATEVNKTGDAHQNSPVIIDKKEDQTLIRIGTNGPLAPYLGSGSKPPPPEDIMNLVNKEDSDPFLNNIHLETGIGVNLNRNTNIDIGYRFDKVPSLMENREMTDGQIRFGIQFQY